jgi:polyisoprenoid-binding protein YceI
MTERDAMETQAQPVALGTWQIDPKHSSAEFAVRHMMVTTVKGHITGIEGTIEADEADPTRSTVRASLDVATIETRDPQRDAHLRSADFFDVEEFPKVTFESTRIEPAGDRYRVVGNLTLHGVTREIVLDTSLEGRQRDPWGSERAGFSAQTVIDRRDFGLTWNQALEAGAVLVGNDVRISIEVEAVRQAS